MMMSSLRQSRKYILVTRVVKLSAKELCTMSIASLRGNTLIRPLYMGIISLTVHKYSHFGKYYC